APVILFLSGGPGGTEIGTLRNQWSAIERAFTVVVWDQTGAGLNGRCWPRARLTLERVLADAEGVLQYVADRFGRHPTVVGNSWGTFLGVLLVQARPDLVQAYVGTGQMADLRATDVLFYEDTLAWAHAQGRSDVADELLAQGPPPYDSMYPYEEAFAHEGDWNAWDRDPAVGAAVNPLANVVDKPELDPVAKVRYLANLIDTFSVLYPQVQDFDLRRDAASLAVPVYLAQGVHEARGRAVLARAWFDGLDAPHKEWIDFPHSGHKAFGEEPEAFLALLRRVAA
uniref:alpha/beta fold hydrolase n=1 Tax=Propioniciclava sp. TaxID=2038686 RepID=UPI00261CED0B